MEKVRCSLKIRWLLTEVDEFIEIVKTRENFLQFINLLSLNRAEMIFSYPDLEKDDRFVNVFKSIEIYAV